MRGRDVKRWRKKRGYSQEGFAEIVGIAQNVLSEIEREAREFTPLMQKRITSAMVLINGMRQINLSEVSTKDLLEEVERRIRRGEANV